MRDQAQILGDIRKLAEEELNAPWNQDYEDVIRDAIHGNEREFPHHLVFRAGEERATEIQTEIPWKLVKRLVSHPAIKKHIHPSGIRLSNARITTDCMHGEKHVPTYDFFLCRSTVPLMFTRCRFDGELNFDFCNLKSLGFLKSTMHAIHLRGAEVEGPISFDGCFFNRPGDLSIKAHEMKVGGTLSLRECVAVGGIRLLGVNIGGDIDATGAFLVSTRYGKRVWSERETLEPIWHECLRKFHRRFDLSKLCVQQTMEAMRNALQEAGCDGIFIDAVSGTKEQPPTLLPYEVSEPWFKSLDLSNAVIGRHVKLRRTFRAFGEVSLNSANIGGAVLVRGAFFFQPDGVALSMDAIKIEKDLYIQQDDDINEEYKNPSIAHGSVSMRGANILHRFVCSRAFFECSRSAEEVSTLMLKPMREREAYALFAKRLHVGGDLMLNKAEEIAGDELGLLDSFVSLENASIGGRLFLCGKPSVAAARPPFLNLAFADIKGSVELSIIPISESCHVSLRSTCAGSIDIEDSRLDKVKWDLTGLEYNAVESYNVDNWIAKVLTTSIQPYDRFLSFLMKRGDEKGAWNVGIAKENKITSNIKREIWESLNEKKIGKAVAALLYFLWRFIIKRTVKYGYNPLWAMGYLLVLWGTGVIIFSCASGRYCLLGEHNPVMFPTKAVYYIGKFDPKPGNAHGVCNENGQGCGAPEGYPVLNPWWYSLELATPIPDLGQQEHWDVKGGGESWLSWEFFVVVYKWFHTIVGWFLSVLIVLSPTKLLRRD